MIPSQSAGPLAQTPNHILVMRLSALGDIALLANPLACIQMQHPNLHITLVIAPECAPLFAQIPRLDVVPYCKKSLRQPKAHAALAQTLADKKPSHIIDMHGVLRTRRLVWSMRLAAKAWLPVTRIQKPRWSRWQQTRRWLKHKTPAPAMVDIYRRTLERAGWPCDAIAPGAYASFWPQASTHQPMRIVLAPIASKANKTWPQSHSRALLQQLCNHPIPFEICLVGGANDKRPLQALCEGLSTDRVHLCVGAPLEDQIKLVQSARAVITMDSFNLHLADALGIPSISLWGPTSPSLGFAPQHPKAQTLGVPKDKLSCRPCSTFGQKPCLRGDLACMQAIDPQSILVALEPFLQEA